MTSRADLIETAAQALINGDFAYATGPGQGEPDMLFARSSAELVLDAVLPQITTAEQLQALPDRSKVVDPDGDVWRYRGGLWVCLTLNGDGSELTAADLFARWSPLTVV